MNLDNGLNIKLYDVKRQKVITLDLEDYVLGAVAFAMPPDFPEEALKAQAICCRTIAVKRMMTFGGMGCTKYSNYDICNDPTHCQGFMYEADRKKEWSNRYKEFSDKIRKAVEHTKELIIVYNDNPIESVYHTACGGHTEDSENVWGNKVSYLRRVECLYCKDSPYWKFIKKYSIDDLKKHLSIDYDNDFEIRQIPGLIDSAEATEAGRIRRLNIFDKVMTGEEVKNLLGLPSTRFSWKISSLSFQAMGLGHGVGMCQYGARGMALMGNNAESILKNYFTGVKLKKIKKPTLSKPLTGKKIVIDPGQGGDNRGYGPMGLSEGYVNLEIAKELRKCLAQKGAKVFLTREKNENILLTDRVALSNKYDPDITISINQSKFRDEKMQGTETFYYIGDEIGKKLSEHIQKQLVSELKLKDLGTKEGDLYILRETNNPSVMVNVAFLTNPEEERLLSEPEFRHNAANAIAKGIEIFYKN